MQNNNYGGENIYNNNMHVPFYNNQINYSNKQLNQQSNNLQYN
jgi:hypothetical protein